MSENLWLSDFFRDVEMGDFCKWFKYASEHVTFLLANTFSKLAMKTLDKCSQVVAQRCSTESFF